MRAGLPVPRVTARIVTGATTNRVDGVRKTAAGVAQESAVRASAQRRAADAIAAQKARQGARPSRRKLPAADRKPLKTKGLPDGWVAACISMPREVLAELDAVIDRCTAAGAGRPGRSRMIRIALARLDVDAVINDLRRTR